MINQKSIASMVLFAGSALCFFLPFVTVSCGGMKAFTVNGTVLATGASIEIPQAMGPPLSQKTDVNPLATIAVLCALAGVALSLAGRKMAVAAAASGAVGAISLGIMGARMNSQVQAATEGMGQANLEIGYFLAVSLLGAAAALNIYLLAQGKGTANSPGVPSEGGSAPSGAGASPPMESPSSDQSSASGADLGFCASCGAKRADPATFCGNCGARLS